MATKRTASDILAEQHWKRRMVNLETKNASRYEEVPKEGYDNSNPTTTVTETLTYDSVSDVPNTVCTTGAGSDSNNVSNHLTPEEFKQTQSEQESHSRFENCPDSQLISHPVQHTSGHNTEQSGNDGYNTQATENECETYVIVRADDGKSEDIVVKVCDENCPEGAIQENTTIDVARANTVQNENMSSLVKEREESLHEVDHCHQIAGIQGSNYYSNIKPVDGIVECAQSQTAGPQSGEEITDGHVKCQTLSELIRETVATTECDYEAEGIVNSVQRNDQVVNEPAENTPCVEIQQPHHGSNSSMQAAFIPQRSFVDQVNGAAYSSGVPVTCWQENYNSYPVVNNAQTGHFTQALSEPLQAQYDYNPLQGPPINPPLNNTQPLVPPPSDHQPTTEQAASSVVPPIHYQTHTQQQSKMHEPYIGVSNRVQPSSQSPRTRHPIPVNNNSHYSPARHQGYPPSQLYNGQAQVNLRPSHVPYSPMHFPQNVQYPENFDSFFSPGNYIQGNHIDPSYHRPLPELNHNDLASIDANKDKFYQMNPMGSSHGHFQPRPPYPPMNVPPTCWPPPHGTPIVSSKPYGPSRNYRPAPYTFPVCHCNNSPSSLHSSRGCHAHKASSRHPRSFNSSHTEYTCRNETKRKSRRSSSCCHVPQANTSYDSPIYSDHYHTPGSAASHRRCTQRNSGDFNQEGARFHSKLMRRSRSSYSSDDFSDSDDVSIAQPGLGALPEDSSRQTLNSLADPNNPVLSSLPCPGLQRTKFLVSTYIDYLVEENERMTDMSKAFTPPTYLFLEEEEYVLQAHKEESPFPSHRFSKFIKEYFPQVDAISVPESQTKQNSTNINRLDLAEMAFDEFAHTIFFGCQDMQEKKKPTKKIPIPTPPKPQTSPPTAPPVAAM